MRAMMLYTRPNTTNSARKFRLASPIWYFQPQFSYNLNPNPSASTATPARTTTATISKYFHPYLSIFIPFSIRPKSEPIVFLITSESLSTRSTLPILRVLSINCRASRKKIRWRLKKNSCYQHLP